MRRPFPPRIATLRRGTRIASPAYDDIEQDLAADYERFQGNDLTWEEVRPATRAAWDRVDQRIQTATRN